MGRSLVVICFLDEGRVGRRWFIEIVCLRELLGFVDLFFVGFDEL